MKKHTFYDPTNGSFDKRLTRVYYVASKMALKYGASVGKYNQRRIDEFWDYPESSMSEQFFRLHVRVTVLKSFINTYMTFEDPIWTSDFLHGLIRHGKIQWNRHSFPTVLLNKNSSMKELLKECPFGGRLNEGVKWAYVPALYLKFSEKTIPFMAGVLAGAVLEKRNGYTYAKLHNNVLEIIKGFGIPIEETIQHNQFLISPIWIALFSPWMPDYAKKMWEKLSKPFNAHIYCPVLWRTYVGTNFKTKGIPYLLSRRKIFYMYNMKELRRLRIDYELTELDYRIRDVVKLWSSNKLKEKNNEVYIN